MGLTGTLLFAIIVTCCGSGFQHGYNGGVVNAPQSTIESWMMQVLAPNEVIMKNTTRYDELKYQTTLLYSTLVSLYCLGGMVGGFMTNLWSNIFGRKGGIMANNIFIFISAILMGFSKTFNSIVMLIVGRFIVGINNGLNAGLVPMYLSEIPPIALRGGVGSMYQLLITISILLSQIISNESVLGTKEYWPLALAFIIIPAVLQILLLPFCADSPRYLQEQQRDEDVKKALLWFRQDENVQEEVDLLKAESEAEKQIGKVNMSDLFTVKTLRTPLIISCFIMAAQQFSGINAVIFYSTSTFESAKLSQTTAQNGTILIGLMNVFMTVISTAIVDKAGRKTLLVIGFGSMVFDTAILCVCLVLALSYDSTLFAYAAILFVVLYVVFFAVGPGSIPWLLVSELFLQNARQQGASIAVAVNWLSNFIVSLFFPTLQNLLKAYVFLIFVVLQTIFVIFIIVKVPETKNRSVKDIVAEFE
ncbi:hypothetical protein PGB90_000699 [Kerria lacca]